MKIANRDQSKTTQSILALVFCMSFFVASMSIAQEKRMEHAGHQRRTEKQSLKTSNILTNNKMKMAQHTGMLHHGMHHIPRFEKTKHYSAPPQLMGKQMGVVNTLNVPPLGYTMEGNVKVFTLVAQPVHHVFTDAKPINKHIIPEMNRYHGEMGQMQTVPHSGIVWGYNGSMPGPTIEATEGDTIRIIFKNELPEPTSIHWHGLEVPNDQDGAGGNTEPVTMPGSTRIYQFKLYQSGTFMYHTGFNVMKQDALGLGGFVVIHPKNEKNKPDKEFAIMLQQWTFEPGNPNPNIVSMDFNWFTFNGTAAPSIPAMTVKQGERVRIRIANLAMQSHPIHIHGYSWRVVGTEGGPIPKSAQWPGATVNVAPGTTRDVEFIAWTPGIWRFHCHRLHHIMNAMADIPMGVGGIQGGMFTFVHVIPKAPKAKWQHPKEA